MTAVPEQVVGITSEPVRLEELLAIADGAGVVLSDDVSAAMQASRDVVDGAVARRHRVYGLNTGVGHARDEVLPPEAVAAMQPVLLAMHAGAFGAAHPREVVRATIAARVVGLTRGGSGASPAVAQMLVDMLNSGVTPVVPGTGSVGAGDLGEHALIGLVAIGRGQAEVEGQVVAGAEALRGSGLHPLTLEAKDGLALISANGVTLGHGALVLRDGRRLLEVADVVAGTAMDAVSANPSVLAPVVQAAKGSRGQERSARRLRVQLADSERTAAPASVQDPLSFRVVPQVHGACGDVLDHVTEAWTTELNAMTDNPLAAVQTAEVLSNGNFHPVLVALGFEGLRLALAHVAQLSERRTGHLWQAVISSFASGPPPVLASASPPAMAGLQLRYAAAARYTRIRQLADPVTLDVPPLDFGQEDHSTNAPAAVACTREALDVLLDVLAVEAMNAYALLTRLPAPSPGAGTQRFLTSITRVLEQLEQDAPAHVVHQAVKNALPATAAGR